MGNGYWDACKKAQCDKALLTVGKAVIFVREGKPFEDNRGIYEIKAVLADIDSALALRPDETHGSIVATRRICHK